MKNKIPFLSIILSFFFINGIIYLLDTKLGYFNILHSSILRNIESSKILEENEEFLNESDSVVILISNQLFEKEFNSITPLNKDRLSILVKTILEKKPKSLIFDLDISPDYDFFKNEQNLNQELYTILADYANELPIVLPYVFIAQTNENKNLKSLWIDKICKENIKFALPFISNELGSVLQYRHYKNQTSIFSYKLNNNEKVSGICNSGNYQNIEYILSENEKKYHTGKTMPINYHKINNSTMVLDNFNDIEKYDFKDKTIFLGGGYGFGDKYLTPYGEKFGVEILNAIYYTQSHKINHASAITTLIVFDISIGLSFGFLIAYLLKKRQNANIQSKITLYNMTLLLTIVLFSFLSLWISASIFHDFYLWLNPIPILVGMFIDSIMGLGEKEINDETTDKYIPFVYIFRASFIGVGIYGVFSGFYY